MKLHPPVAYNMIAALMVCSLSNAAASSFNYNYVQLSHTATTDDTLGVDIDFSAIGVSGSMKLNNGIVLTAGYFSGTYDQLPIDARDLALGLNLHTTINPRLDFAIDLSLLQSELETPFGGADDSGYIWQAGIRHAIIDRLEFDAYFSQTSIFDETNNMIGFGLLFEISRGLSVGVEYGASDHVNALSLGLRLGL